MKKSSILVVIVLVILCVGVIILKNKKTSGKEDSKKIGAIITLTGDGAFWSKELKKGMDLATSEINNESEKIKIIYEDNGFNANKALSAYKKIALTNDIDFYITCFTPMCKALADVCEKSQSPLLMTITSTSNIANGMKWIFRDYITQKQQCPPLANYVFEELNMKKGAYLALNDDYGLDGVKVFSDSFKEKGGLIIDGEFFEHSEKDLRSKIKKVLINNPSFIFVIAGDQSLPVVCRQIREIDTQIQIIGLTAFDSEDVWNILGDIGEGVVFSSGYFAVNNTENNFFVQYEKTYQKKPNATNVYGYSIVRYLYEVIDKSSKTKTIENIEKMQTETIRGILTVEQNHDINSTIGIYRRINGKTELKKIIK